jgi:hypothetical protein
MTTSANPIVQMPASEDTHVVKLTMETPFGLMHVTSAPMRVSEAAATTADYMMQYVEPKLPYASRILDAVIQRK